MILAGKTFDVKLADATVHRVTISMSDELRFEQRERISLAKVQTDDGAIPLWVIAGIIQHRLRRSGVAGIPSDLDEFMDLLDVDDWLEIVDEGKAAASGSIPLTG